MSVDPAQLERVRRNVPYSAPSARQLSASLGFYAQVPAWKRSFKRSLDVVTSVVALAGFALLLPFIALAIKLDSRGPVFYRQTRVGINRRSKERRRMDDNRPMERRKIVAQGLPFEIIKLRTMYVNSEPEGVRWAHRGDPRITRVGNFLRKTRLDEVPQFWNVLQGDMSVVGPRPERPPFIELLRDEVPGYLDRLRFKPGITGLAQVELGYDTGVESVRQKVEKDMNYITQFRLRRDVALLLRTFKVVFTGKGAC